MRLSVIAAASSTLLKRTRVSSGDRHDRMIEEHLRTFRIFKLVRHFRMNYAEIKTLILCIILFVVSIPFDEEAVAKFLRILQLMKLLWC